MGWRWWWSPLVLWGHQPQWPQDEETTCSIIQKYTFYNLAHVKEICELGNQTYVALIKLLTEVDDIVFLQKSLQHEIEELFPIMSSNKHAFSVIFSIFSPRNHNFNILGKYEHTVAYTECKKSE
jgi:hypothetical protein